MVRTYLNVAATILAIFTMLAASACTQEQQSGAPEKLVFMAGFKPQANLPFAAAYIAHDQGYFAEENLDVEIRHASTGEHLQLLMSGEVDVTTADAPSVLRRRSDPGLPIVAFALFGQRGQQGFISLKESGIETPADWEGKRFGYKISVPPDYLAILKAENVDRSQIQEVSVGFDPRVLTEGQVDILAVFKSNEPDVVRNLGLDVNLWDPADFGVPTLGLTYITREELAEQAPDKVQRFLNATIKAMQFAIENPEETVDIVLKFAPEEDRAHQEFMLAAEIGDATSPLTDQYGPGWMADEQWEELYSHLFEFEAIPNPFDYRDAYTDEFLRTFYEGE